MQSNILDKERPRAILLDLDGTVHRGNQLVPGAKRFIKKARSRGCKVLFVTNRSTHTEDDIIAHLRTLGIPAQDRDILTSARAAAEYLPQGRAYCIGEKGLKTALNKAGFVLTARDPEYVIVGLDRRLNYEKLAGACTHILAGARFVVTNPDMYFNTDHGLAPGAGAIAKAIQATTGVDPEIIGKPQTPILEIALTRLKVRREQTVIIGDNPETDVGAGVNFGIRSILLLTCVVKEQSVNTIYSADHVASTYSQIEKLILA